MGKIFSPCWSPRGLHAVEIQRQQVRLDLVEQRRETIEMGMAMMQVIDQADVVELQLVEHRQLILGLAEPAPMVVEAHLAAQFAGRQGQRTNRCGRGLDLVGLQRVLADRQSAPKVAA